MESKEIELKEQFLNNEPYQKCEIQIKDYSEVNYEEIFDLMRRNCPFVIKNIAASWECSRDWVINNDINYDFIINKFGNLDAPVANCNIMDYNAHQKSVMKVEEYINYLRMSTKEDVLYLKDWHLKKIKPDQNFYEVPHIFASDWLNEFCIDHEKDDFMFVYIGPETSWTPLHSDVYSSFSWSVNVFGKKKWVLLPPGEEEKLKDSFENLPILFKPENFSNVDYLEITQDTGDAIFVPSGWHHQVFNVKLTISINHNFINACNIDVVWKSLIHNLILVEKEIKEFKDTPEFSSECQLILKSCFGLDLESFVTFVTYIGNKRIKQINGAKYYLFNTFTLMNNHIMFDLQAILKIINLIETHPTFTILPQSLVTNLIDLKRLITVCV